MSNDAKPNCVSHQLPFLTNRSDFSVHIPQRMEYDTVRLGEIVVRRAATANGRAGDEVCANDRPITVRAGRCQGSGTLNTSLPHYTCHGTQDNNMIMS